MNTTEFKFHCAHCGQRLICDVHEVGREIQCPACQFLVHVPNPSACTCCILIPPQSSGTWDTYVPKGRGACAGSGNLSVRNGP